MSSNPRIIVTALLLMSTSAFSINQEKSNPALDLRSIGGWGVNLADRDTSVSPGDDFNLYENGAWFATAQIDPRKPANSYWGDLRVLTSARVGEILAEAAADLDASPESATGKLSAFYRSFMDIDRVAALGIKPLEPRLNKIRNADKKEIAFLMGEFEGPLTERSFSAPVHATGTGLMTVDIVQDPDDASRSVVSLGKAGILLPTPDYYSDPRLKDVKDKYQEYIATQLRNVNWEEPDKNAAEIVKFETKLAEAEYSSKAAASPSRLTFADFCNLSSDFDWSAYLQGADLSKAKEVIVDDRDALVQMAKVFAATPIEVLRARLAFALPDTRARYLTGAPADARLAFRGTILNGQQVKLPPRESMAGDAISANVGDLVGGAYLKKYFPKEYQDGACELVANLKKAFDNRIAHLDWMSGATKVRARKKLANMKIVFGARELRDYAGLRFDPTDLYGNLEKATSYNWRQKVLLLEQGLPVPPNLMAVQTANYNYVPSLNLAEAPAGLFQSPFFDPKADPAVNYGAVGTVVAMTMVQAFVEDSRMFDENGRHVDWWTKDERAHFDALAKRLSEQYSAIEPIPGLHVKGDLLIAESLGDNGAMSVAMDAYHLSLGGKAAPVIDGFTGDQRFFMGRAQMWRAKFRPEFVRNQLATASNAPPFLRINGSVRNADAWYDAFGVKPGDKMYLPPADRVHIW